MRWSRLAVATAVAAASAVVPAAAARAGPTSPERRPAGTISVPGDAKTIQAAVDRAQPGTLVLVAPGVYRESVVVNRPDIVIRGVDRNRTILDGQFLRTTGVTVVQANGVAIENLTARDYLQNGFYWDRVDGYRGSYLTAYRNGAYGLYALGSQHGQLDHSYASGNGDSGFYIGTCRPCHAVINNVRAEYNALGYSGSNAGGDLYVVRSVWRRNRAGIVPNSVDTEPLPPQDGVVVAGNEVTGRADRRTARPGEFDAISGTGIAVLGGLDDVVTRNRVSGQARVGILVAANAGIQGRFWPAERNRVTDNVVTRSGTADLATILTLPGQGNCFEGNRFRTSAPAMIERAVPCSGAGTGALRTGALGATRFFRVARRRVGTSYRHTPVPPAQAGMPHARTAPPRPATAEPTMHVELGGLAVPSPGGRA